MESVGVHHFDEEVDDSSLAGLVDVLLLVVLEALALRLRYHQLFVVLFFFVRGAGFRVQGAGFRVQGSGCRVQG